MDFNVLIADLNNSIASLTKESAAGSNFNSVYCRKVSKAVDQIASNSEYSNVVTGLWCVAMNVAAHVDYLKPIRALTQLCLKIFRQCAKVILNIQWQNIEEDSSLRQNFLESLENLHGKLVPLSITQFHLLEDLAEAPWTHPTLAKIMGGETDDSNKEEVHSYIENEDPVVLQLRVDMMLKENCEEFALNLCNSYLSHPKLRSNLNIRKTQLDLLYKLGQEDKLQEECQKLNIQDAVQVIKLLQTSRAHRKMCTVLTQTFMVQNWIRPSNLEASKELLKLWIGHQLVVDKEQDQFKESVWAVAKLSQATEQIALLIDVLREECGDSFLQLFVDMCIFAINVDKGQMEANWNEGNREAATARRSDMASICDKLSSLCHQISIKVARIGALTAFALKPTEQAFRKICAFYGQVSDQSDQSPNGKNQSPGIVNPATLYEVERLLNMLRPGYLNPDQLFVNIQILCQRYLQECLKQAEEFQKSQCLSETSSDAGSATVVQTDTSRESAASTSSNMSTILAESFSFEDVQNVQQLLSKMRVLNIVHPKPSLQCVDTSPSKIPPATGSLLYDHTYQSTKHKSNIIEMHQNPYMSGPKKLPITHQHHQINESDRIQQKGNRTDEQFQISSANQPQNTNLTSQTLQQTKRLHEIIQAALEQDTATLLKLAQSSSPEMIQAAINIIKSKLPNSSLAVNDQQHRSTSSQINSSISLSGAHPQGGAQLQPSSNLQQRQPQLLVQRQDGIREHSSQTQSSNLHLYNQPVVTVGSNNIPHLQVQTAKTQVQSLNLHLYNQPVVTVGSNNVAHLQVQTAKTQASNSGSYTSPSSLIVVNSGNEATTSSLLLHNQMMPSYTSPSSRLPVGDNGKQVTANSLVLHNINQRTPSSSATSGILSQEKLKAESLLLAKSCVGEIRHLLQAQLSDVHQKQMRETPQTSASVVNVASARNGSTLAGPELSSSSRLQSACQLAKQTTVGKIQENFSRNILYQIQQQISKQEQNGITGRPYTLSVTQPRPLYQPQCDNSKSSQQTISTLVVPSSTDSSNVGNGKTNAPPASYSILQSLKQNVHGSVGPTVTNTTNKPQNSSVVMIKQPKIISFSNLPVQSSVIEVNKCPALYVTTCPVSCFNKISQSNLNSQHNNPFTQHNFPTSNIISQPNLNSRQVKPLYQNILPNLNSLTVSSLNSQQPNPAAQHIMSSMTSQSNLNNGQFKPPPQDTLPKVYPVTVSSLNNLQTSPSVQHVFTKPSTGILSTVNARQPEHSIQNTFSNSSLEIIHKGQQYEVILTNCTSVKPTENLTVLQQTHEAPKNNNSVSYSKDIMESKSVSDNNCTEVSNNALYRCILCGVAFKTLDDLRHHVKNVCKPEQQSSSVYNTKFKLNRASATNAGIEATTVFQCLRCLELCISESGIKQHRLICKKVPLKPLHIKDSTDNKEKEALAVSVCYNSSSIEEINSNNKALQGEAKECSNKECNSQTGDSSVGHSISTVSVDTSCQLTLHGQLEDSIGESDEYNKQFQSEPEEISNKEFNGQTGDSCGGQLISTVSVDSSCQVTLHGQLEDSIGESNEYNNEPFQSEPKEISDKECNGQTGDNNGSHSVVSMVSSCQPTSSGQLEDSIDMQTAISAHGIEQSRNVGNESPGHLEPKSISNQETANEMRVNTFMECESENIFSEQTVVTSAVNQPESKQSENSNLSNTLNIQAMNDVQVNTLVNSELRTILSQQTLNISQINNLLNAESRIISEQQAVNDAQTSSSINTESKIIPSHEILAGGQASTESRIISGQKTPNDEQINFSLNTESRIIPSHEVTATQTNTESSKGPHSIPELRSQSTADVPIKSESISLPDLLPVTSHSNKALAAAAPGHETEKRNLVTFQPDLIQPVSISNSENLPPLSTDLLDCLNIPQITVASVITNTAFQMPLSAAFINSSSVFGKNTLFPLNKLGPSIEAVISNKNKVSNDNLSNASPKRQAFKSAKVLPGATPADLAESRRGKYVICKACSKIACPTSSFHLHGEMCSKRNKTAVKTRALQEKVQNAKHVRDDVFNYLMRVVENVAVGDTNASKVVCVDAVKSSLVPILQVCTDEVKRNSSENAESPMQIVILPNETECNGSSQGDIQELKTDVGIDSEAENKNTRDTLVILYENSEVKEEMMVNKLRDGGLVTNNLPEINDTEAGLSQVQSEAYVFTKCAEEAVTSGKTKENEGVGDSTNSKTEMNSDKCSLFCNICQVFCESEKIMLQHFVVKHLKPYTVKTSNRSLNYVCHFCRNSFTTFRQYMQHVPRHSVIVYEEMKSLQSAKTSQSSFRNALQQKLTKKYKISKNITKAIANRKTASRFAAGRLKRHVAVGTQSFLDRWQMSKRYYSCVPTGKDYNNSKHEQKIMEHNKDFSCNKPEHKQMEHDQDFNCNKPVHTVVDHESAVETPCSSDTKCLTENNSANYNESCCLVEKSTVHSSEYLSDTCHQKLQKDDHLVDDTCGRSSRNIQDVILTRRRKAVMENNSWSFKKRRMTEVTEIREGDQEFSKLEERVTSGYINPDSFDIRNSQSADHQVVQGENLDFFDNINSQSADHQVVQGENLDFFDNINSQSADHQVVQGENLDFFDNINSQSADHQVVQGENLDFFDNINSQSADHQVVQDENLDFFDNINSQSADHQVVQDENLDFFDNINSQPVDHQAAHGENVDFLKDYDKTNEPRNNNSVILNQNQRKNLQPNSAHPPSVETLLCSKDLEAASGCISHSTITTDTKPLLIVEDIKQSATKLHVDVTVRPSSYIAPKTVKPSFLDSYLSYISNCPLPGRRSKKQKSTKE